jgi:ATP-dependent Lon protease
MTEEKLKKSGKKTDKSTEGEENKEESLKEAQNKGAEESPEVRDNSVKPMPMIPLRGLSIFPYMVLHFDIGREKSISALEKAMMMNQMVFLSAQKDAETDLPNSRGLL